MVKLRDVLPLQMAETIEEATGCQRFGDLVQNPWNKIAAIPGLSAAAKRELRRIVKTLGLDWSTHLAPWPPVGPPAFLDSLEINGRALAQIALARPKDTSTSGARKFRAARSDAALGVGNLQEKLIADGDGVITVADVLARAAGL